MNGNWKIRGIGLVLAAAALAVASSAFALSAASTGTGAGPGMMMGSGYSTGGASVVVVPTTSQLTDVHDQLDAWLTASGFTGFKVAEVMAFANNDYAAVHDANGKPAFELLTNRTTTWVMEEPPSMMWNTRYGMMGDLGTRISPMMGGWMMGGGWHAWYGTGAGKVTSTDKAVSVANLWLAKSHPGEQVAADAGTDMAKFPGYWTFDTTRASRTVGMLSVNASTGVVWYHGWHGKFLAELDF